MKLALIDAGEMIFIKEIEKRELYTTLGKGAILHEIRLAYERHAARVQFEKIFRNQCGFESDAYSKSD